MSVAWADPSHADWLAASAALQRVAARVAGRPDVMVRLHPGAARPPEGTYDAAGGEIALGAEHLLVSDRDEPAELAELLRGGTVPASAAGTFGRLVGALVLQSAVARHGALDLTSTERPDQVQRWLVPLEHARVARAQVARRPGDRRWLLTAADILTGVADDSATASWLTRAVAVTALGAAGALSGPVVAQTAHRLALRIGQVRAQEVAGLCARAVALDDDRGEELVDLADTLSRLLDASTPDGGGGGDTDEPSGDEEGADAEQELDDALARVVAQAQRSLAPLAPRPQGPSSRELLAGERENDAASAARLRDLAAADIEVVRAPDEHLRRSARQATASLRLALSTVSTVSVVPSQTPPGRLRMGEAMRREAQVDAGIRVSALPWRQTRRSAIVPPELHIGLSLDVSGSHLSIHSQMCDLVWLLATAAKQVAAEVAAVSWNSRASILVRPGHATRDVIEPACEGSSTACGESLRALSGLLGLRTRPGIRILVVASDGRIRDRAAVVAEVESLSATGVGVVWVAPETSSWSPPNAVVVTARPEELISSVTDLIVRSADSWH